MKSLQVFALLFNDDGKPLANAKVRVEYFELAQNAWSVLAGGATDAQGNLALKIALANADTLAPNLRLCEDTQGTRVLAQHAQLSYNTRSQALICDFGQVEQLDDTAYAFAAVQSQFANTPLTFAGQGKRPDVIAAAAVRRAIASAAAPASSMARASGIADAVAAAVGTVSQPTATIANISLDSFNAELIKFRAIESDLQLQISAKDRAILSKDAELSSARTETQNLQREAQTLKAVLEQAQKSEALLKQENAVFVAESQRLSPIENIATNIGSQVAAANQKLRTEQKPYQIQNIQVELRGTLSQDGQAINLLKMADLKEGVASASSLVKMDLVTTAPPTSQEPVSTVPDVSGFTESVARRLLKSVGLKMEMVSRSVGSGSQFVIGQAIAQSPVAGAVAKHSEPVLVIFAVE